MQPLGAVKTVAAAGTPEKLSATSIPCTKIWIQPMRSLSAIGTAPVDNTGNIYLLNSSTAKGAASTNVIATIAPGQNSILLEALARNTYDLSRIWIDADNNADGALISYE